MDCERVSEMMYLFFDNEMEEELLTPFRNHLDGCSPCAHRMDYTRKMLTTFRERCTRHQAPARLRARIRAGLSLAVLVLVLVGLALPVFAQDVRLRGLRGEELRDADLAQGTTIVVVWASWSPRGRDIVERVNHLVDRWGGRARVITVNFQEDRGTVEGFLNGKSLRAPVFLDTDGSFSKKNAVTTLPGLLVIQNGEAAYRAKLPDDPDAVLAEIIR